MNKQHLQKLAGILTEERKPKVIRVEITSHDSAVVNRFTDLIKSVGDLAHQGTGVFLKAENNEGGEIAKWSIDGDGGDRIKVVEE